MTDIEGRPLVENPYISGSNENNNLARKTSLLIQRFVYMGLSLYGLNHFNVYQVILHSPHVSHEWFKVGLAATIAFLGIKAYVEIFEGRINKRTVNYSTFPQSTHAAIALFLFSGLCYHVALWPHYHFNSVFVLGMAFFGVILPLLLMIPSWLQNLVSFVALTFFLQQYS